MGAFFLALVVDNLADEQCPLGLSIQTFLIGIGAVLGSWMPLTLNSVFGGFVTVHWKKSQATP